MKWSCSFRRATASPCVRWQRALPAASCHGWCWRLRWCWPLGFGPASMIFDEVDAGIGGEAALEVGRRLAVLGQSRQVICVTHLPQVAAFADRHLLVAKDGKGADVHSGVCVLDQQSRIRELSRMLAGVSDSKLARGHAAELLAAAAAATAEGLNDVITTIAAPAKAARAGGPPRSGPPCRLRDRLLAAAPQDGCLSPPVPHDVPWGNRVNRINAGRSGAPFLGAGAANRVTFDPSRRAMVPPLISWTYYEIPWRARATGPRSSVIHGRP